MSLRTHWQALRTGIGFMREYRRSQAAQRLSRDELAAFQWRRLKRLLAFAYRRVPFYARRFREAGLTPRDIRSREDLEHLPPLTKRDIQEHRQEMVAAGVRGPLYEACSSGSTGEPTIVYRDARTVVRHHAVFLRNLVDAGYRVGERLPQIWAGPWAVACPDRARDGYRLPLGGSFGDQVALYTSARFACIMLSVFEMSDDLMDEFAAWLRRQQPSVLMGYTIAVDQFAQHLQRRGIDDIRPRGLITTAESLLPAIRARLERVFGCRVYNRYATNEVSGIAQECGHADCEPGLMHVNEESILLEVADDGRPLRPGESGHVLVTDLANYAMPLIRYDLLDIAARLPQPCPCGRPSTLLSAVDGRVDEFFLLPDHPAGGARRLVNAAFFRNMFHRNPGIVRYQVLQDEPARIEIKIVKDENRFDAEAFETSRRTIAEHLGPQVDVRFAFVAEIAQEATGKFRYTLSRVYREALRRRNESAGGEPQPPEGEQALEEACV